MQMLGALGIILGGSFASGVNLYLTTAALGISHRLGWIALPGNLDILGHPLIIALAIVLYVIEFFADKIPYVDSAWDAIHTFIRPVGGAAMAYLATSDAAPIAQAAIALAGGGLAFDSHLAKAGTRVAINASPEPFSNIAASVTEDVTVLGAIWLMITHPIVLGGLVLLFVLFSIWFLPKLFRLFGKVFGFLLGKKSVAKTSR